MWVYKITNLVNNKTYIGQSRVSIKKRWLHHCFYANHPKYKSKISRAIAKHGRNNFSIEEIATAQTLDELNSMEAFWINFYNSIETGYNIRPGGMCRDFTEIHKANISRSLKGRPTGRKGERMSEEVKEKIRRGNTGKKMSPESIAKFKANRIYKKGSQHHLFGKRLSDEIIEKSAAKRRKVSLSTANEMMQRYLNGESIKTLFKECPEVRSESALRVIIITAKKRNGIPMKKRKTRSDKGIKKTDTAVKNGWVKIKED